MREHDVLPDIEIARRARLLPVGQVAQTLGVPEDQLEVYGRYKAKVSMDFYDSLAGNAVGKLVLVSAINPTPSGEGKTTTTVGLGDALNRLGKRTAISLREPSLGPCFGMKGGAAGGGMSQVAPMEDINLHFTGDIHAIGIAHNLLAAAIDNHIHHRNRLNIDPRRVLWKRAMDMNDRALREIVVGLGGTGNSYPRESGFEITVASEVMAVFCLSESLDELRERLGRIIVAYTRANESVTAADLNVHGAMAVLLRDALKPNLVQTLENNPAIVHGGPFANIAHGCNSVIATKLAMRLSEYTVTEAGFGADLGAEKFLNIKCRQAGIRPDVVVLVATVRGLKYHGGASLRRLSDADPGALEKGLVNLRKHIENIRRFGLPAVVAVNRFLSDTSGEIALIQDGCADMDLPIIPSEHWAKGGGGAEALARTVVETAETASGDFKLLYPDSLRLWDKARIVAREVYGADNIMGDKRLRARFRRLEEAGHGRLPVCMAKTQYSLSTDPGLKGRPRGFDVPIRDVRVSAGAGFVVVYTGDVMTMPGLPRRPSAEAIDYDDAGHTVGLF
ncbi:MAG: formate--tetrahydrofolate ligase [Candidatus Latescibacteria bacterium]|nr:formate--tetrahydrofolate ligase [Candidatus Latescibacterota bacterium]